MRGRAFAVLTNPTTEATEAAFGRDHRGLLAWGIELCSTAGCHNSLYLVPRARQSPDVLETVPMI